MYAAMRVNFPFGTISGNKVNGQVFKVFLFISLSTYTSADDYQITIQSAEEIGRPLKRGELLAIIPKQSTSNLQSQSKLLLCPAVPNKNFKPCPSPLPHCDTRLKFGKKRTLTWAFLPV